MSETFTIDGGNALERQLAAACRSVCDSIQSVVPLSRLDAVVLGGGYGRGEGGVLRTASGDRPYNDLEFYVFMRGNRIWNDRKYSCALHELGHRLSPAAGVHVEFKVDSLARLRRSPVSMFSYDLVSGHRVIQKNPETDRFAGDSVFAGCEHHLDSRRIPLEEATRLLFNRCTGLLFAGEFLRGDRLTEEQADFVGRNLAKAQLALGDVVLTAFALYHWSCLERRRRLGEIANHIEVPPPWLDAIRQHHDKGVEFKLHPCRESKSREQFERDYREISGLALHVWLWLENRRLNGRFASARDYAFSDAAKCRGTSALRNILLHARSFTPAACFGRMASRYPRERLLNSLPLLLWDESGADLQVKQRLQTQLRTTASDRPGLVAAYRALWPNFS